jgi:hypothetical protein
LPFFMARGFVTMFVGVLATAGRSDLLGYIGAAYGPAQPPVYQN